MSAGDDSPIDSSLDVEQARQHAARGAQADLVERVGVGRGLEAHVEGSHALSPLATEEHLSDEARGGIDHTGAPHGDEQIAALHAPRDLVEPERDFAEPHDVRAYEGAARAAWEVLPVAERAAVVMKRCAFTTRVAAAGLEQLAVDVNGLDRSRSLVERVHVLRDEEEPLRPECALERGERDVPGVWAHRGGLRPSLAVEALDEGGVCGPSLGGGDDLDAVVVPQAVVVAKGADPALCADAGAREDDDGLAFANAKGAVCHEDVRVSRPAQIERLGAPAESAESAPNGGLSARSRIAGHGRDVRDRVIVVCMYAITITMRALPGHGDELVQLSLATVEPSRAEAGCLFFDLLRSEEHPDEILFYEAYRSRADFDAHLATAHVRAWQVAALPIIDRATIRMPSHVSVADAAGR